MKLLVIKEKQIEAICAARTEQYDYDGIMEKMSLRRRGEYEGRTVSCKLSSLESWWQKNRKKDIHVIVNGGLDIMTSVENQEK